MPFRVSSVVWCALTLSCWAASSSTAHAQSAYVWDGIYGGVNAGATHSSTCSQWASTGTGIDAAANTALTNVSCLGSGFVGGVQIGDSFQSGRFALGLGADIDIWHVTNNSSAVLYSGAALPKGTYDFHNQPNPTRFVILGPRVGYAGNQWMPYLRVGAMVPFGGRDNSVSYTPTTAASPTASFETGKGYSSLGWVAGAGAEVGLTGAWSLSAEYLHVDLGKASSSTAACGGTAANCAALSGITFTDAHDPSRANMFRIGVSYWFNYWD
jgi:outer membrane immunogenic protein